jgi:cyclic pyranopterin phosphate synthase
MSAEEIVHIAKIASGLGISRMKLTGGEPLLRKDILEIVGGIAGLRGLRDLSMTTNGTFLEFMAKDLKINGLNRVNVSLPTLNQETYHNLMGGNLKDAVDGVKAAVEAELYPVKLNMLLLKGINEGEVEKMIQFAEQTMTILQLIELEPLNNSESYYGRYHLNLNGIEETLKEQALEVRTRQDMQNRRVYFLPQAKVEVIHPIENTEFCARCTRLRVTSDGKLKPCLMRNDNLADLLSSMRKGINDEELTRLFLEAVKRREPYYKAAKC